MKKFVTCMKKYATFSGRATRSEYWLFYLWAIIFSVIPTILGSISMGLGNEANLSLLKGLGVLLMILSYLISLALFLPSFAVCVRRLHDIGKSGTYILLGLIPLVGSIILLIFACTDSQKGTNQYGISEKYPS
ncbi:MAG: DUF805 domain-containing protein [Akkermansia sp.]